MSLRKALKGCGGGTAIEFAVIVPVLFIIFSGVVNIGFIIVQKHRLAGVMNVGALYSVTQTDVTSIKNAMINAASLSPLTFSSNTFCGCNDGSSVGCTTKCSGNVTPGNYVQITASTSVSLLALDFFLTNPYPLSATFTIRTS